MDTRRLWAFAIEASEAIKSRLLTAPTLLTYLEDRRGSDGTAT